MRNIIIILCVVAIATFGYVFIKDKSSPSNITEETDEKIRMCPDSWIENRMPGPPQEININRQYFIIDGERKEIDDYDLEWIKENCDIRPKIVY